MRPSVLIATLALATAAIALPAHAHRWHGSDVALDGCTEAVGLDLIPAANAAPLVPPEFSLVPADEAGQLAIILVRVVECASISVDGAPGTPGKFMHVGLSVQPGDPTADVNNYQLWFATDHLKLKRALREAGVDAEYDDVQFDFTPNGDGTGAVDMSTTPRHAPAFEATGTAFLLDIPRTPFIASWWAEGRRGIIQMRAEYQDVLFGVSDAVLTTPADSALAALAGTDTLSFVVLNTYNDVPTGDMTIEIGDPNEVEGEDDDDCRGERDRRRHDRGHRGHDRSRSHRR